MKNIIVVIFVLLFSTAEAQILWNGVYSVDIKKGGVNSSEFTNGVQNGKFSFYPGKLQLFIDAEIEEDKIYFNSKIEANTLRSKRIAPLNVYQISVSLINLFDRDINFELGRILTPFGRFKEFQHSPDNPFTSFPLSHRYYTNVSRTMGFRNSSINDWLSNNSDAGLEIIYHGTYFIGAKIFGSIENEIIKYDLAITNGPVSSFGSDIELNNYPAFTGRVVIDPTYWLSIGSSFGYGNYLNESPANKEINVDDYNQIAFGADLRINYLYYDFLFEFINNRWESPLLTPNGNGGFSRISTDADLDANSLYFSLKIDLPFFVGCYIAGKYEMLTFNKINNPFSSTISKWNTDQKSFEIAAGYKLSNKTLLKFSYQKNNSDIEPEPDDDVFGAELSVVF